MPYDDANELQRILIVDDNPRIHEDFRKILCPTDVGSELGAAEAALFGTAGGRLAMGQFEIGSAHQGQEGLAMVEKAVAEGRPYAMAFVDVRMPPGWDGVETIGHLWACYPELQVVICTAYSDYSWEEIVGRLGRSDSLLILKKPFDNVEVLQLAHALTKKHTVTRQAARRMADLDEAVLQRTTELMEANEKLRREISERARAQEELRLSEERFAKSFKATPIPLALLDRSHEWVLSANDSFLALLGRPVAEVHGASLAELSPWPTRALWVELLQRLDQGQSVRNAALKCRRKDGGLRDVLVSLESLVINQSSCLLLIAQDVTEQLQLEARLRQTQKMEAIGQLAAGVAHDFNNILTVIQGHTALRLAGENLDREVVESLQQVQMASNRAAALTRQLLAFSRKQVVEPQHLDVSQVVLDMLDMLRRVMSEQIELHCECPLDLPLVHAEKTGIEQIVMNLVVNARDAMPEGGRVVLRTESVRLDASAAQTNPQARPGRFICLSASDTGHGIDPQILSRVFEPFFTTKQVGQGTGLGLAIVYGVAKQHGGWVEVGSAVGQGTTFKVFLPCRVESESSTSNTTVMVKRRHDLRGTEHVLVVEDDPSLRELTCQSLRRAGYQAYEAANATEAERVWQAQGGDVDLLLTDVVLPAGGRGETLAQRLREKQPGLKVIFSTGYSPELLSKDVVLLRGVNFLQKPYDPNTLLATVRHCLDVLELPVGAPVPEAFDRLPTVLVNAAPEPGHE